MRPLHDALARTLAAFVIALPLAAGAAPLPPTPATVIPNAIVTLGTTAGPNPRRGRAQASNLLSIDGTLYLIDAGDNATRRVVQSGYDFRKIGTVFITHDHSDHTLGLPTLMVDQWEFQRRDVVDIYGPPGTAAVVQGALQFAAVNADIRYSEGKTTPMASIFKAHEVQPGPVFSDSHVTVTAVENTHFHFQPGTPPYGKYKSYSYRFNTTHGSIVFTGDTGPSDAVIGLAKGADILVSEILSTDDLIALYTSNGVWQAKTPEEQAGFLRHMHEEHLTPQDVGVMATKAGVKTVIVTHMGPTLDPNDTYERYVREVGKYFSGKVLIASDLKVFPL
jgi:ribonuclease BN (tRNA processing enzyme)